MANQAKMVFGSTTTVISHAATLNSATNTYSGLTGLTMTQLDNSTDLYPYAIAVLGIPDTLSAAPTAGVTGDLYMSLDDIDGTSDETPLPGATDILYLARYVGSFVFDNQDVAYIKPVIFPLHGVKKAQFYLNNVSGVNWTYSTNPITVKVTPFTYGPT